MDFLPNAISATITTTGPTLASSSYTALPPFAECIVFASLCGHSVAHRRFVQSRTFADCTPDSQVFWLTRHQWLAARGSGVSPPPPPPVDPLCTFTRVLACGAAVSISDAAEVNPWQTLEDSMALRQCTYQIAVELVLHLQNVPRLAVPKVRC